MRGCLGVPPRMELGRTLGVSQHRAKRVYAGPIVGLFQAAAKAGANPSAFLHQLDESAIVARQDAVFLANCERIRSDEQFDGPASRDGKQQRADPVFRIKELWAISQATEGPSHDSAWLPIVAVKV